MGPGARVDHRNGPHRDPGVLFDDPRRRSGERSRASDGQRAHARERHLRHGHRVRPHGLEEAAGGDEDPVAGIVLDRAVGTERAPSREPVAESPGYPGRRPDPTRKPCPPGSAQVGPAAVVVGRPRPGLAAHPRPSGVRAHPAAVPVRVPGIRDCGGHPHRAVVRRIDPASVAVETFVEIGHGGPGRIVTVIRRRRLLVDVSRVPVAWVRRARLRGGIFVVAGPSALAPQAAARLGAGAEGQDHERKGKEQAGHRVLRALGRKKGRRKSYPEKDRGARLVRGRRVVLAVFESPRYAVFRSFSNSSVGSSPRRITPSVILHSLMLSRYGTSYWMSSIAFSMMARRPRAPALRRIASWAMDRSASLVNVSFTRSISNSFWYCFTSAFFGCVRMVTRSSSVRSSRVASIGKRPTHSGIMPNLIRSSGSTSASNSPTPRLSFEDTVAPNPNPFSPVRRLTRFSIP